MYLYRHTYVTKLGKVLPSNFQNHITKYTLISKKKTKFVKKNVPVELLVLMFRIREITLSNLGSSSFILTAYLRLSSVPPHNTVNIINICRITKTSKQYCKHREKTLKIQRIRVSYKTWRMLLTPREHSKHPEIILNVEGIP